MNVAIEAPMKSPSINRIIIIIITYPYSVDFNVYVHFDYDALMTFSLRNYVYSVVWSYQYPLITR